MERNKISRKGTIYKGLKLKRARFSVAGLVTITIEDEGPVTGTRPVNYMNLRGHRRVTTKKELRNSKSICE